MSSLIVKKKSKTSNTQSTKAEPTQPSNNAQTDSSNSKSELEEEEKIIHVDFEEITSAPPSMPQKSTEIVLPLDDDSEEERSSIQANDIPRYSIYPATYNPCHGDPWFDPPPTYYALAMSENPPYYPRDNRFCADQSESSSDDFAQRIYNYFFGVNFYFH